MKAGTAFKRISICVLVGFLSVGTSALANPAEDGDATITGSFVTNSYTTLGVLATAGNPTITVASAAALTLPACGAGCASSGATAGNGFGTVLAANDLLMIYQPQELGGSITTVDSPAYGTVTDYGQAGSYEFVYVSSVAGNVVTITTTEAVCTGLKRSYDAGAMVVRVPQLRNLTINSGGVLSAPAWDGSVGGVIVADVRVGSAYLPTNGTIAINGTGRIRANGIGFRGGEEDNLTLAQGSTINLYVSNDANNGGRKGESILGWAGNAVNPTTVAANNETGSYSNGAFSRAALANGGGGGGTHNGGGGGGANGGSLAAWNGGGNPDPAFAAFWALDNNTVDVSDAPTVTAASVSSGGGRGGYSFGSTNQNALTVGPGCLRFNSSCGGASWGGNDRLNRGGMGGRPLDRRPVVTDTVDRVYFGGGGGAGDGNNSAQVEAANGGGLIYLIGQRIVSDAVAVTTLIEANGATAANTIGGHNDAPGGGGAGGTIIVVMDQEIDSEVRFAANGGNGGNQLILNNESEGPGGGGGGGVVALAFASGAPASLVNGGLNGTTSSTAVTEFPPNGATRGGSGTVTTAPARNSEPLLCLQTTDGAFTTPVTNGYFKAQRQDGVVQIEFATSAEVGNLGFKLYGERSGRREPIAGQIASRSSDSVSPQSYSVAIADGGYDRLYLADVSITGKEALRGPFNVGEEYGTRPAINVYDWSVARQELAQHALQRGAGAQSAYLRVTERGMQRVTHEALVAAGIDLGGTPVAELALLGRAGPIVRRVRGGTTFGPGSVIEFHGDPTPDLYARTETYLLKRDSGSVRDMAATAPLPLPPGTTALQTARIVYAPQIAYSFSSPVGDPWYAARIVANGGPANADFNVIATSANAATGTLRVNLWGGLNYPAGALPDHHVRVLFNGAVVADRRFDGLIPANFDVPVANVIAGNNVVRIELPRDTGNPADLVHLESIELHYSRTPIVGPGPFVTDGLTAADSVSDGIFADGNGDGPVGLLVETISRITIPGLGTAERAFRIDAGTPVELEVAGDAIAASHLGSTSELWLSDAAALFVPSIQPAPPTLTFSGAPAKYWVLTHGMFAADMASLIARRQSQGLTTALVDVEQIYLAYSAGNPDPMAISRFMSEHAAPRGAQYLLLVGGDTTDAPGYLNSGSVSFLPTPYMRTNEIVAFAPADPLYGDLTGDSVPEISVGRLPVRTHAEADEAVRKILSYEAQPATSRMMLVAGAADTNQQLNFAQAATRLSSAMPPVWQRTEVYSDVLGTAAARSAIVSGFNSGQSLISYTGHSSPFQWGFEQLLSNTQVAGLETNSNQPIVVQFGCWTTYFVAPTANSMGHALMLFPLRGASAVLGSTVLLDQPSHDAMAAAIAGRLNPGVRIGDAVLGAKRQIAQESRDSLTGVEIFVGISLLGDPAQPIR